MLLLFDCCLLFGARQWGDLVQDMIIKGDGNTKKGENTLNAQVNVKKGDKEK